MARRKRGKEFQTCKRCGRSLADPDSRVRGYGPVCFMKIPAMVYAQLEEAGQLRLPGIL